MVDTPSDRLRRRLAAFAMRLRVLPVDPIVQQLVELAHHSANNVLDREDVIRELANMVADGRLDASRLGAVGNDPDLVRAVYERLAVIPGSQETKKA